MRQLIVNRS